MCFNWLTYYREVIYKFYNRLIASVKFLLHPGVCEMCTFVDFVFTAVGDYFRLRI